MKGLGPSPSNLISSTTSFSPTLDFLEFPQIVQELEASYSKAKHLRHKLVACISYSNHCRSFFIPFKGGIFPCSPGWPKTRDLPATAFHILGLQACIISMLDLVPLNIVLKWVHVQTL